MRHTYNKCTKPRNDLPPSLPYTSLSLSLSSSENILLPLQLRKSLLVVARDDAASGDALQVLEALGAAEPALEDHGLVGGLGER